MSCLIFHSSFGVILKKHVQENLYAWIHKRCAYNFFASNKLLTLEQSSFKPHLIAILDVAAIELVGLAVHPEIKILSRFIRPQIEGNVLFKRKACALLRIKPIKQCAKNHDGLSHYWKLELHGYFARVCMSLSFLAHGPINSKSILVKWLCVLLTRNYNKDRPDGQILTLLWCQAFCVYRKVALNDKWQVVWLQP